MFEHLFTLTYRNFRALVTQQLLWGSNPARGHFIDDNRSLDKIYEAICNRIREKYEEHGIEMSDDEIKEAADNLLRFCYKVVENNLKKE